MFFKIYRIAVFLSKCTRIPYLCPCFIGNNNFFHIFSRLLYDWIPFILIPNQKGTSTDCQKSTTGASQKSILQSDEIEFDVVLF